VKTNTAFLRRVIGHEVFAAGEMDTGFIDAHLDALSPAKAAAPADVVLLAALAHCQNRIQLERHGQSADPFSPWFDVSGWRLSGEARETVTLMDGDVPAEVEVIYRDDGIHASRDGISATAPSLQLDRTMIEAGVGDARVRAGVFMDRDEVRIMRDGDSWGFGIPDPLDVDAGDAAAGSGVAAPMTGKITQVWVKAGDKVARGAPLIALEAMKMEHTLSAPADLTVADVLAGVGDQVEGGAALVVFDDPDA